MIGQYSETKIRGGIPADTAFGFLFNGEDHSAK